MDGSKNYNQSNMFRPLGHQFYHVQYPFAVQNQSGWNTMPSHMNFNPNTGYPPFHGMQGMLPEPVRGNYSMPVNSHGYLQQSQGRLPHNYCLPMPPGPGLLATPYSFQADPQKVMPVEMGYRNNCSKPTMGGYNNNFSTEPTMPYDALGAVENITLNTEEPIYVKPRSPKEHSNYKVEDKPDVKKNLLLSKEVKPRFSGTKKPLNNTLPRHLNLQNETQYFDQEKKEGRAQALLDVAAFMRSSKESAQILAGKSYEPNNAVASRIFKRSNKVSKQTSAPTDIFNNGVSESNAVCLGKTNLEKINSVAPKNYEKSGIKDIKVFKPKQDKKYRDKENGQKPRYDDNAANQRESLINQLKKGSYECMVCCGCIGVNNAVWSCSTCYHVFHLHCIQKWAKSSKLESGEWRCPGCQNTYSTFPNEYRCFCSKQRDPKCDWSITPHSCGNVCSKNRLNTNCTHKCIILCHPGPCPPCSSVVTRLCGCGKLSKDVRCLSEPFTCGDICGKLLNCEEHSCSKLCHLDSCDSCQQVITLNCFCGKTSRTVNCTKETSSQPDFQCSEVCNKLLSCGNHSCPEICHKGDCPPCRLLPALVTTCPCGKTSLDELYELNNLEPRKSCLDSVPICDKLCEKRLGCGSNGVNHICNNVCHIGDCPPCTGTSKVVCKCGAMTKEVPCSEMDLDCHQSYTCLKKCQKKRQCGRHRCNQECCVDEDHVCPLVCGKMLNCGLHRCEALCHIGSCRPCLQSSFEELTCHCGVTIMYPPIPCGAKPPECDKPCARTHSCDHPVAHNCHSDDQCPPCTFLMDKWCHGAHEIRKHVPCHLEGISCGHPCNKELPCGRHRCLRTCHQGDCLTSDEKCTQSCKKTRSTCDHPCNLPCHEGPCPASQCKEKVRVTCDCGYRMTYRICGEKSSEYQQLTTAIMASKMASIQDGQSVDIGEMFQKGGVFKLPCDEDCAILERNRRLAECLQIENPNLSNKPGPPPYTDFLKTEAKSAMTFAEMVEKKLIEVVELAKLSKQKSRSVSFPPGGKIKRRFVHEYCEFFGCESASYDDEPNRNVIVTAYKDKAYVPTVTLLTVIQREVGPRKMVPWPSKPTKSNCDEQTNKGNADNKDNQSRAIDYFDYA